MAMKLEEVYEIMKERMECTNCGSKNFTPMSYDHDGGEEVSDKDKKQWIYGHCNDCGYDSALWKMFNRMQAQEAMK